MNIRFKDTFQNKNAEHTIYKKKPQKTVRWFYKTEDEIIIQYLYAHNDVVVIIPKERSTGILTCITLFKMLSIMLSKTFS